MVNNEINWEHNKQTALAEYSQPDTETAFDDGEPNVNIPAESLTREFAQKSMDKKNEDSAPVLIKMKFTRVEKYNLNKYIGD